MENAFGELLETPGYLFNLEATNKCLKLLPKKKELDVLRLIGKIQKQYNVLDGNFIEVDLRNIEQVVFQPLINSKDLKR